MGENTINNATVVTVDAVVEKICNLLTNSAKSTFGTYTRAKNIRNDSSNLNHGLMMSVGKQGSNLDVRNENLSEIVHKL